MEIKFKKIDPRAVAPVRATEGSAGYDLTATQITTEINECGQLVLVYHTGLAVEIPYGYEGQLCPRSSISKKSLRLCNAPGTIDSDYRGEITGKFISTTDVLPAVYKEGDRFAQLVITKVEMPTFVEAAELSETSRGEGGYGSTDNKEKFSAASGSDTESVSGENPPESISADEYQTATEQAAGEVNTPEQVQ